MLDVDCRSQFPKYLAKQAMYAPNHMLATLSCVAGFLFPSESWTSSPTTMLPAYLFQPWRSKESPRCVKLSTDIVLNYAPALLALRRYIQLEPMLRTPGLQIRAIVERVNKTLRPHKLRTFHEVGFAAAMGDDRSYPTNVSVMRS